MKSRIGIKILFCALSVSVYMRVDFEASRDRPLLIIPDLIQIRVVWSESEKIRIDCNIPIILCIVGTCLQKSGFWN